MAVDLEDIVIKITKDSSKRIKDSFKVHQARQQARIDRTKDEDEKKRLTRVMIRDAKILAAHLAKNQAIIDKAKADKARKN